MSEVGELNGVRVLVTGATSGLGAAMASALAEAGARVMVTSRDRGPPIVWLASDKAADVHDQRIVATEFDAATAAL